MDWPTLAMLFADAVNPLAEHIGTILAALLGGAGTVGAGVGYLVKRLLDQQERTIAAHEAAIDKMVTSSQQKDQLLSAQTATIKTLGESVAENTEETRQLRASFDRWTESQIGRAGQRGGGKAGGGS